MDNSPLLLLPAELRNNIYTLVLLTDRGLDREVGGDYIISFDEQKIWEPPALLHVCRQIRNEASGIYYVENIFSVVPHWSPKGKHPYPEANYNLAKWLLMIDPVYRSHIRKVYLDDDTFAENRSLGDRIKDCRNHLRTRGASFDQAELFAKWEVDEDEDECGIGYDLDNFVCVTA